ncbi:MAG: universal stress protein [Candidatus Bathyarchaeia archaeon]
MIERVLVALDGSEPADKALDFALDLAEKYSAEIVLLSVIPPVAVPTTVYEASGAPTLAPVVTEKYWKEVEARYEKVLQKLSRKPTRPSRA